MVANDAMTAAVKVRGVVEAYLKEVVVSSKYADKMLEISKDQIQWIGAEDFAKDFEGYISELADWIAAECDKRTDAERAMWDAFKDKLDSEAPRQKMAMRVLVNKMMDVDNARIMPCST